MELPQQIAFKLREDNHVSLAMINRILRENKMGKLIFSVWICSEDGQNTLNQIAQFLEIKEDFEPKIYEVINGGPNSGSWVKPILAFEYFKFLPKELTTQATNDLKTFLTEKNQPIELYQSKLNQTQITKIIREDNIANNTHIEELHLDETSESEIESKSDMVKQEINNTKNNYSTIFHPIEETINKWVDLDEKEPLGFHVDFDAVWPLIGYSQKGHAKNALIKNFHQNTDFCLSQLRNPEKAGKGAYLTEKIMTTIDTIKQFGMMAQTDQGKAFRQYFINVERKHRLLKKSLDSGRISMVDNKTQESYKEWKEKVEKAENQIKELESKNLILLKEKEDDKIQAKYDLFLAKELAIIDEKYKALLPIISEYYEQPLTYLAYIGTYPTIQIQNRKTHKIEFGYTADLQKRKLDHESDFDQFKIIGLFRSPMAKFAEREFANQTKSLKIRTTHKTKLGNHIELVFLTEDFTVKDIFRIMQDIIDNSNLYNAEIEKIKAECLLKLKDKDLELERKNTELSRKDVEISNKNTEIVKKENELLQKEITLQGLRNELRIYKPQRKIISKK